MEELIDQIRRLLKEEKNEDIREYLENFVEDEKVRYYIRHLRLAVGDYARRMSMIVIEYNDYSSIGISELDERVREIDKILEKSSGFEVESSEIVQRINKVKVRCARVRIKGKEYKLREILPEVITDEYFY